MPRWLVVFFLPLALGVGLAQYWDIESVDSVYQGQNVFLRQHPDGRIMLCYEAPDTSIRVAWKGSVWHRERVPTAGWLTSYQVGRHGGEAVCAGFAGELVVLAVRRDSGWQLETLDFRPSPWSAACAFDTAGRPRLAFGYASAEYEVDMIFLQKSDTGWQEQGTSPYFGPIALWTDRENRPVLHDYYYFESPAERRPWNVSSELVSVRDQDTWREVRRLSSYNGWIAATSVALDTGQVPHLSGYVYNNNLPNPDSGFFLDDTRLDDRMSASALVYDNLNRPQLACRLDGSLEHRYLSSDGWWHRLPVPGKFSGPVDMLVDTNDQPIILAQNAGTLYLIRGHDIVGLDAESAPTHDRIPASILLRRGMPLNCRCPARLADIAGRTVLCLRLGQNVVPDIPPGVYHLLADNQPSVRVILLP